MTGNSVLSRFGKLEFGVQVLTTGHWPNYKTVVRKNKYACKQSYIWDTTLTLNPGLVAAAVAAALHHRVRRVLHLQELPQAPTVVAYIHTL
jgi:hypothetical protein